jgi:hypothetical protein
LCANHNGSFAKKIRRGLTSRPSGRYAYRTNVDARASFKQRQFGTEEHVMKFWSFVLVFAVICALGSAEAMAKGKRGKGGKKRASSPSISSETEAEFKRLDTNGDWQLTLDEWKAGNPDNADVEAKFKELDKDSSGYLTLSEFAAKDGSKATASAEETKPKKRGKS